MNSKEAQELGFREAKAHPILIFGLYGIAAIIAFNLPIAWYWRIATFFVLMLAVGFARTLLGVISGKIQLDGD
jgi:hypothetical protein